MKRKNDFSGQQAQESTPKKARSGTPTTNPTHAVAQESGSSRGALRRRTYDNGIDSKSSSLSPDVLDTQSTDHDTGMSDSSEHANTMHTPVKEMPRDLKTHTGHVNSKIATPSKSLLNKKLFSTPVKTNGVADDSETPRIERNADRSARRKSTRNLIERTILGNTSDNEEEEDNVARHLYDSGGEEITEETTDQPVEEAPTPSKRGRPRKVKERKQSPTPPRDLESHEKYFFHNRGGRAKTSNNDLSTLALLDHEEYFSRSRKIIDPHREDVTYLGQLHAQSFNQWQFELSQDFNICVFGYGSKRNLLMRFANHVYQSQSSPSNGKIVIINGYVKNLTIRDILNTVASAVAERGQKLGSQPSDMLESVIALLEVDKSQHITLIIHSIDNLSLRRGTTQTIISRLSAHPQVHLVASADHPSFTLLWDSSLRSTYNFLFHDCTTFQPYNAEIDVVDEVHDLLGRSGRRVGGKEGVSFVLKSLPENAKNLFRVLVGEQLAAMEGNQTRVVEDDSDEENEQQSVRTMMSSTGVEYRILYQKAVEEFICSNEMNFRTLLKEFHDHQMIQSRKDGLGTEILSVPFRKEELEMILEDISS